MATSSTITKFMKLSLEEYNTLSTSGSLTKDGVTYTYSPNDTIYLTPENESYITVEDLDDALATKADKATTYTKTEVNTALNAKQNTLTAGNNITITDDTISAKDQVFIATVGMTSASEIHTASLNGKVIIVSENTKKYTVSSLSGSGNSATIVAVDKDGLDSVVVTFNVNNTMWMKLQSPIPDSGNIQSKLNDKLDKLSQASADDYLVTANADGTIIRSDTTLTAVKETFRIKQWADATININIPSCTQDISNTNIPKMTYSITGQEGFDYQIVGMIAYEVFDAESGGNRINCWPVCQFTGNGQKELSVRWMCAGPNAKNAKRVNAWILLKHR